MTHRYNVFYDDHADHMAWRAYDLWMHGETAQDVGRALGNSMAVPVMRWIGERIQEVDE